MVPQHQLLRVRMKVDLLVQIQEQIENYATGAQQYDDITMLAARRMKE